jgi:hypothetical protein
MHKLDEEVEHILQHYGIKGMRWGIQRDRNRTGGADGKVNKPDYSKARAVISKHSKRSLKNSIIVADEAVRILALSPKRNTRELTSKEQKVSDILGILTMTPKRSRKQMTDGQEKVSGAINRGLNFATLPNL